MHLVYPSFRPTFFTNHRVHLLAEGFNIFRIGKKVIQYLRDSLLTGNDQNCIIRRDGMSSLAVDVELMAARLTTSNRRAMPSTDLSTPLASLMSHISISFCGSVVEL